MCLFSAYSDLVIFHCAMCLFSAYSDLVIFHCACHVPIKTKNFSSVLIVYHIRTLSFFDVLFMYL